MPADLEELRAKAKVLGLRWRPGETANSHLSRLHARTRTGAVPPAGAASLVQRAAVAADRAEAFAAVAASLPPRVDWRANNGNYVTPVRDQAFCGSCVAFGTVAALESMIKIKAGAPSLAVDLSEAQLFFCYGPDKGAGACPDGGWWPDDSYPCLKAGVVDEACFPYTDDDQPCNLAADWKTRLTKISAFNHLTKVADMKHHLATVGPIAPASRSMRTSPTPTPAESTATIPTPPATSSAGTAWRSSATTTPSSAGSRRTPGARAGARKASSGSATANAESTPRCGGSTARSPDRRSASSAWSACTRAS